MTYALAYHRMVLQREQRQSDGGAVRVGDFVQCGIGGEIRQVMAIEGAGEYLEALANTRAREARTTDKEWMT